MKVIRISIFNTSDKYFIQWDNFYKNKIEWKWSSPHCVSDIDYIDESVLNEDYIDGWINIAINNSKRKIEIYDLFCSDFNRPGMIVSY